MLSSKGTALREFEHCPVPALVTHPRLYVEPHYSYSIYFYCIPSLEPTGTLERQRSSACGRNSTELNWSLIHMSKPQASKNVAYACPHNSSCFDPATRRKPCWECNSLNLSAIRNHTKNRSLHSNCNTECPINQREVLLHLSHNLSVPS